MPRGPGRSSRPAAGEPLALSPLKKEEDAFALPARGEPFSLKPALCPLVGPTAGTPWAAHRGLRTSGAPQRSVWVLNFGLGPWPADRALRSLSPGQWLGNSGLTRSGDLILVRRLLAVGGIFVRAKFSYLNWILA